MRWMKSDGPFNFGSNGAAVGVKGSNAGARRPQVLLSLGASPDYKDRRGLTPLYHTVLTGGDTSCCETLLYHHAKLGIRDENGWDETHQVHGVLFHRPHPMGPTAGGAGDSCSPVRRLSFETCHCWSQNPFLG